MDKSKTELTFFFPISFYYPSNAHDTAYLVNKLYPTTLSVHWFSLIGILVWF